MKKIASFTVDHTTLEEGLYVSRIDEKSGMKVTTFDIRMVKPRLKKEQRVMSVAPIHAIEHLGATYLRNHPEKKDDIIYFGPMGCRTGFYLIVWGEVSSKEILPLVKSMYKFVSEYEGKIPGASPVECGNYLDLDLDGAKKYAKKYLNVLENIDDSRLKY